MPVHLTRALFMPCSARKLPVTQPTLARAVYDGPIWKTYRAAMRAMDDGKHLLPFTVILSAKYGIIGANAPILSYDQRLDPETAQRILKTPSPLLREMVLPAAEILLAGGKLYRDTMRGALRKVNFSGIIREPRLLRGTGDINMAVRQWILASPKIGPRF